MTIHSDHPFLPPEEDRDPVRRLRGRVGSTVTVWTSGAGPERAGLTVSSYLVSPGEPPHLLGLVHPDSELLDRLVETGTAVVQLLGWRHRELADVFAGLFPSPGGPFRHGDWEQTAWGPVLTTASAWAGVRLAPAELAQRHTGWSMLVDTVVEHVVIGEETAPLVHRRGRYQRPSA